MPLFRSFLIKTLLVLSVVLTASVAQAQSNLTVKDFLASPEVFDAEFSPDGRYLALIVQDKKNRVLMIRDFDSEGKPITGMIASEFRRPSSVSWATNERLIVNILVPRGESEKRLRSLSESDPDFDLDKYHMSARSIAMDVNAKNVTILMEHNGYLKRNNNLSRISNFLPNDAQNIMMPMWGYRSLELHRVNIDTGKSKEITSGSWRTYRFLSDENGRPTYRLDYYYYGKKYKVYEYSDSDRWEEIDEIYFDQDDDDAVENEGLLRFGYGDNHSLIYRERNKETGFYEIIRRNRGNEKREVVASLPNQDIHSPIFDSRTSKYLGYQVQEDLIRNHYVDAENQLFYDKIVGQIGYNNFSFWSSRKHGKRVVLNAYSADNPGAFYYFDFETEKLSLLSDKYKKLAPEQLATPGKLTYKTRDGVNIQMYVLLPPGYQQGSKVPMVIIPHGGPHLRDSLTFDSLAQFISTRGYIVIQPNFRGSSGYGLDFEKAGYKQWGGIMQDDLTDAVNFMVKEGYADAKRVCIVGGSYGGYAALMGAIKTPDLYQCSVSLNGVSHLKDQIEYDVDTAKSNEEQIEKLVYERIGHPVNDSASLDTNSPALHANKIKIPILIFAGEDDKIVPIGQSERMVDALEEHKKEHYFFEIEDSEHNLLYYKEDIEFVYTEIEKFLARFLSSSTKDN